MPRRSDLADALVGRVEERHVRAFHGPLAEWFERHRRPMPWREPGPDGRRDPYRVWISEVMLQQTRVETALPYFERFTSAFPTVHALAEADQDAVLKNWEGLGYYSRARNLHRAAQAIVAEHDGRFPETRTEALALPGVGPYTAAAVLSLSFGVPLAVLDGNVIRVLSRVFAVEADTRKPATRTALQFVADALLDHEHPGRFNESVMELGATVCTPRSPACAACPLRNSCAAVAGGDPEAFPVVSKRKPVPHKTVAVGLVQDARGRYLIQRRPEDAMLGGLWEFPGGKVEPGETPREACRREVDEELRLGVRVGQEIARVDHAYSHFTVTLHAFQCTHESGEPQHESGEPVRWVAPSELDDFAFPRANRKILEAIAEAERQPGLF
ncbi:MAG: A/G-specific adenine glycosylase [Bacteroidota bacterium]